MSAKPASTLEDLKRELAQTRTERDEAIAREAALAEVLEVINASPGDPSLVFDTILAKAHDLCGASFGSLQLYENAHFHAVATHGMPEEMADLVRHPYQMLGPDSPGGQFLAGGRFYQAVDLAEEVGQLPNPRSKGALEICGIRTLLFVPLRRENELLGLISAGRTEVKPFAEKEIALLERFAAQAVIAMENARLITETREALEQQTATAEVLKVINASPGNLTPVFDAILDKAHSLCGAEFGALLTYDGEFVRLAAQRNLPPAWADIVRGPWLPRHDHPVSRIIRGERLFQIEDMAEIARISDDPVVRAAIELGGIRSLLLVPLRKDHAFLGYITAYRQEVRPFTDKQIALLENFAAQAVIAMENARLLTETREALEQQTATAEVLGVINSSPGDLAPVLDAMLDKALRLCEAAFGFLSTYDGEFFYNVAVRGAPPELIELSSRPFKVGRGYATARLAAGEEVVHIADITQQESTPGTRALAEVGGARTVVWLALRKEDALLGLFTLYRREVRPFTDKQIALLRNFAAQAVIAMENARLLTETRETLEQQTATAEVLQVINASPGDLAPVFDAMLTKALHLCEAAFGFLDTYDGERFCNVAQRCLPPEVADLLREPRLPAAHSAPWRVARGEACVHLADLREDADIRRGAPIRRALIEVAGARTQLTVALRKDNALLGIFTIYRQAVQPFSDKHIALLQNFAAQAVIAMENARLITETREALDQQTATAEVLKVISRSPGDLTPVFEAILQKAHSLCGVTYGSLQLYDGDKFRAVAVHDLPQALADQLTQGYRPRPNLPNWKLLEGASFVQVPDIATVDDTIARTTAENGIRTLLWVALRKDDVLLGSIAAARRELQPFTDKQIALLQNFAAQAVIAIENARLITETREALEQQTATAEVLKVISRSPGDLTPVFEAMLEKATDLCQAAFGILWIYDGEHYRAVEFRNVPDAYVEFLRQPPPVTPETPLGRIAVGEVLAHIADMADGEAHTLDNPLFRRSVELGRFRTVLGVGLRKDAALLGAITIYRQEVRPFTDKQVELLQNFAAQAVIAMENARLITETRERTVELQEALEYQTATSDVLKVMSGSAFELAPVLQTVVSTAVRLCRADQATIYRLEDGEYRWAADHSLAPDYERIERNVRIRPGTGTLVGRVALSRDTVQILDAWTDPLYEVKEDARVGGVHTMLGVPLLREGLPIGVIGLARRRIEPYTDKETELVRTFADQAVIAIENARLLGEIRQRQAELRVTFDNMADGVAMFDQELRLAAWNRNFQELLDLPDDLLAERPGFDTYIRYLTERGEFGDSDSNIEIARLRSRLADHYSFERTRPEGTVIEVRNNPMPDGGVVVIYSDITERKRSEEEIRAARDAAEAAYADLKAAQASLVQAEKMASLGQLTAGIAHEIKNPLNFVNNFASLSVELLDELKETAGPALATLDKDKRAEVDETMVMLTGNLEKIAEHGKRADNIVKSMLEHSRGVSGERREVDLNGVIEEALNLAYHGARAQDQSFNITLERDYEESLKPIELAPQEMTRVFLNLFGNGFYAANKRAKDNGDGSFRPVLSVKTREDSDAIEIRVRDNGTGIPPEIKDRLFQPFFTTKPTGEGTGLGLSISYDIVTQQHGGTITVESEPGSYTEFTVRLPRH